MENESIYERAVRLAKQDNPNGTEQQIKNSTKGYFTHFFKIQNNIKSIGRTSEGRLILNK